jgi:hypothetical protein
MSPLLSPASNSGLRSGAVRSRKRLPLEYEESGLWETWRLLRRPLLCGLSSPIFLRVLRVAAASSAARLVSRSEETKPSEESDLLRFLSLPPIDPILGLRSLFWRAVLSRPARDGLEAFVEMVATDTEEFDEADLGRFASIGTSGPSSCLSRFRPLSCSFFASCSSAIPFLRR